MKRILLFVLFFSLLLVPARANDIDTVLEAVPDQARDILGEEDITDGAGTLARIGSRALDTLKDALSRAASGACVAVAVTLLCSLAGSLTESGKGPDWLYFGSALAVAGCGYGSISGYLARAGDTLCSLSDFSRTLLPCVAAAATAAGHAASGAARYTASCLFMDVLLTVGNGLILPMIYAYVAAAAARAALPEGHLGGPVSLLKWFCTTALTLLCSVFTFYISITGAVSGKADNVAAELTKTALNTALPVVGRILSDAADSYLAGAELLRSSLGVAGLLAVLCICLKPAISLGAYYLLYKAASALTEPFAEGRLSVLLGDIGTACGMALGLVGSGGLMLFISVILSTEALSG